MWSRFIFGLSILAMGFMTATVALAWLTPELGLAPWRLLFATLSLVPGWYYMLHKTAAERDWAKVKARVRK